MVNPVTEYKLTPEQVAGYTSGMDLGQPTRVYQPERLVQSGSINPASSSSKKNIVKRKGVVMNPKGKDKRFKLTKEEYIELRCSGVSRDAIAERNNIAIGTLVRYLKDWGLTVAGAEVAALGLPNLTDKQKNVLICIQQLIAEHGHSPTVREISNKLNLSTSTVQAHLAMLGKNGFISWDSNLSRTIKVLKSVEVPNEQQT